ncbi:unnamed protein product [Rotaria magnacalcarata]
MHEFIIRLRAIWVEQFPQETEADLVKHLFCKIRPDMLNVMGCPRNVSLQETLLESQRVEEILYHRMIENNQINQLFNNATYNNNSFLNGNDAASNRKDDHMRASSKVINNIPYQQMRRNQIDQHPCSLTLDHHLESSIHTYYHNWIHILKNIFDHHQQISISN